MERYIGIDAHKESCTISVIGPTGKVIRERAVETSAKALIEVIKDVRGTRRLCLEESALCEWLYETLEKHVDEIKVIQADRNRHNKSDRRDARALAEAMRVGIRKATIFKARHTFRGLREAVRAYRRTVRDVTSAKNQVTAIFASRAIVPGEDELYAPETRARWIAKLPSEFRPRAALFGKRVDRALEFHAQAREWLESEAKKLPEVRRLMTAPGIALVRAATIVATVVTPTRFRTKRQFWAFCGLAVTTHSTADWRRDTRGGLSRRESTRTRGLNRNRNPAMKEVFKGAAMTVIAQMTKHPLAEHYRRRVEAGTDANLALLTISRRIAAAVLAIWKNEEDYDTSKHQAAHTAA